MKRKIFCGLLAAGLLAFPGTASAAGDGLFLPVAETDVILAGTWTDAPLPLVLPFVLGLGMNECLSFVRDFAAEQTEKDAETLELPEERNFYTMPGDEAILDSEEEISSRSTYIVKGRILPGSQNISLHYEDYTLTDFEVAMVYKGDGISSGDVIQIEEPYHTETYTNGRRTTYRRNNYTESAVGEEYIFFLAKNKKGRYFPSCTSLSRYPLNDEITVTFPGSDNPNYTEENYNKLCKEVLEKYH